MGALREKLMHFTDMIIIYTSIVIYSNGTVYKHTASYSLYFKPPQSN